MGGDTADLRKNTAATRQASRVGLASFETHKDEYKHNHQHDQDDPPAFSTSSSLSSSPSSHDKNADERAGDTATSTSSTSLVATNVQPKPYLSLSNLARAFNKYTRPFFPPNIMSIPTLKIGCAGLGRMGKRHADHFLHKVCLLHLLALISPSQSSFLSLVTPRILEASALKAQNAPSWRSRTPSSPPNVLD